MEIFAGQYDTLVGRLFIYATQRKLLAVAFEGEDDTKKRLYLSRAFGDVSLRGENAVTERTAAEIREYLGGVRRDFDIDYELRLSDFAKSVSDCIGSIPYGENTTYFDIAAKIGNRGAYRAVGNALNHNPIPIIIPCHRVNARSGMLSGYAGGTKAKRKLLEIEERTRLVSESGIVSTDEIVNPALTAYVRSTLGGSFRPDILEYAHKNNIPVSKGETLAFLGAYLTAVKPKRILEIGSAIGYSALYMRSVCGARITTLEKSEKMYAEARRNLAGTDIEALLTDGQTYLENTDEKFDFIYVDCAKGQYIHMYDGVKKVLNGGGTVLYDNVLYKGISAGLGVVKHKNRTIARSLVAFNQKAMKDGDMAASLLTVGDGLLLAAKKGKKYG